MAFFGKPTITLTDVIYNRLNSVTKIESFDELSEKIRHSLNQKISSDDLDKFLVFLEQNSFDFDLFGYIFIEAKEFFHDSVLIDVEIKENKMKNFLEKNSNLFKIIGNELIKKINIKKN